MRIIGRLILSAIFLALTAAMIAAAKYIPGFFLLYTPLSQSALAFLAGISAPFPFALWQVLAAVLLLLAVYTLIRVLAKRRGLLRWLTGVVCFLCLLLLVFTGLWGLNHWAPPVTDRLGLDVGTYSLQELEQTTKYLAGKASALSTQVPRTTDNDMVIHMDTMAETAAGAFDPLAGDDPFFSAPDAPVKPLFADKLFSYMGLTGIFICYTGESNVNPDTYPASLPYTMCHEVAHRLTVAPEDEANFCAFLACIAAEDPSFRYSGWYSAFIHCYNALYKADPDAAAAIRTNLSPALDSDLRRATQHYNQYEGKVQEAATKVNDTYLKAFNEESGVRSYGEAADLLIAWFLQTNPS